MFCISGRWQVQYSERKTSPRALWDLQFFPLRHSSGAPINTAAFTVLGKGLLGCLENNLLLSLGVFMISKIKLELLRCRSLSLQENSLSLNEDNFILEECWCLSFILEWRQSCYFFCKKKKKKKGKGDFSHQCAQTPNIPGTVWRVGWNRLWCGTPSAVSSCLRDALTL